MIVVRYSAIVVSGVEAADAVGGTRFKRFGNVLGNVPYVPGGIVIKITINRIPRWQLA